MLRNVVPKEPSGQSHCEDFSVELPLFMNYGDNPPDALLGNNV
jgi:hypothetical protein